VGSRDVEQEPRGERPAVEPLRTNDRLTVLVGCVVWAVLLVACLLRLDRLEADGTGWWLWTCVAGLALGVIGLAWLQLRHVRGHDAA
jgi:hypothetical protein